MPLQRRISIYSYPSNHQKYKSKNILTKRTSFCTPNANGSITVEAAIAIPIFFLAVISLFYMLEVMSIRTNIRSGMQTSVKIAAEDIYAHPIVTTGEIQSEIVNAVGANRLSRSMIVGGPSGIDCSKSHLSMLTGILEVHVRYQLKLPLPMFAVPPIQIEDSLVAKGWNGYVKAGFLETKKDTVFVAETGTVYHKDPHCTYLDLTTKTVSSNAVSGMRNHSGEKYHACEICTSGGGKGTVYITDYGNRYHDSLLCSGLKRTIYTVPITEAVGKGACSKCCK